VYPQFDSARSHNKKNPLDAGLFILLNYSIAFLQKNEQNIKRFRIIMKISGCIKGSDAMRSICVVLLIFLVAGSGMSQPSLPEALDGYVAKVMQSFQVPAVSIAIVKDGRVLLASGYGVKESGKSDPADGETLFGIASNTKAFTAAALAMLVEENKLAWDGRVIDYLAEFRLSDPYVTQELTVKDLLVHRSGLGLGAGDLLWWPATTYDRRQIVHRLRYIPLRKSFRNSYAYDNVLYTVAGEVIERVSGLTWEDFVQQRIFRPLGMTTSDVRHPAAGREPANLAVPHALVGGKLVAVRPFTSDNVNPAGGIHSNARDMARWMIVQLDSGRSGAGKKLYSTESARLLWTPVTPKPIPAGDPQPALTGTQFYFYALGFNVMDYRGKKLVTHTGVLPGYLSRVAMIPSAKLGVTVLTSQESSAAFNAITYYIIDYYLGAGQAGWLDVYKKYSAAREKHNDSEIRMAETARNKNSRPALAPERYAGLYRDAWYGDIVIRFAEGKLLIAFQHTPDLVGTLEHWQYDTFVARWHDRSLRGDAFITFMLDPAGSVDQATMKPFSRDVDFSFDYQDLKLIPVAQER
jgi:CubicO group peptidase (beta-lactamase class C family)